MKTYLFLLIIKLSLAVDVIHVWSLKNSSINLLEKGILLSFVSTAKEIIEKKGSDKINDKLLKMINNINTDKYEELERKVKVLKTNIILMNKNN